MFFFIKIISNLFTNLGVENFDFHTYLIAHGTIQLTDYKYGTCNCLTSPSCIQQLVVTKDTSPTFTINGLFTGCYILEGVLRSSMNCLYSQTCINHTIVNAIRRGPNDIKPFPYSLDRPQNSSYTINTTFSELVGKLMVESWGQTISHRSYFHSCKPLSCTYSVIARREVTYVITILFGIIGGLDTVLRLIVPWIVSIVLKILSRNKVVPEISQSSLN